nr:hypothetical protein [Candidatus Njordarchaeota archaeon]
MSPNSSSSSRLSSRYSRFVLSFLANVVLLFVIYIIVKLISGAGAFFDIIAILSILLLAFPENIRVTRRVVSALRTGFLAIELLIVLSLVGTQWLAWQLAVALLWIKVLNLLVMSFIGGFEFETIQEGFRRRIVLRRKGQGAEGLTERERKPALIERKVAVASIIIILAGMPIAFGVMAGTTAVLGNAYYFDSMVTKNIGYPSFFTFNSSDVRLVTEDVANAKAKQHMASFGSNVHVENIHITIWDDKLSWTMTVVQQYWLGASYDQHVYGYIVLSATDPNEPPLLVHQDLALASGMGLNNRKDVLLQSYYRDPNYKYDRAILTKSDEGNLV